MEKITLTQAIHDLKTSFRKRFGPDKEITPELENIINAAAVRVKKGEVAEWNEENDKISLVFSRPRPKRAMPAPRYNNFKRKK